jgi:hypothetical protein
VGRKIRCLEKLKQFFVKLLIAKELDEFDPGGCPQILEPQGVTGKFF